jgi:malonyl-CoA O-methyltransferase
MNVLAAPEAYRRWAPTYDDENALTLLERELVDRLSPSPRGLRLLDVGCGTGRRLADTGAVTAVGVEPCPEMLAAGQAVRAFGPEVRLIAGDARALPVPDAAFDLVWCRLMIGHVAECCAVYRELGRAAAPGACVVVTDFHPAAAAAGLRRTFRDGDEVLEVEHHLHPAAIQAAAADDAGLRLLAADDAAIGPSVRPYFERTGKQALYREHRGKPMVLGLLFARDG